MALCGHATLGSAHALWEEGRLPAAAIARFHTKSGLLSATREGDWIWLDFPATPPAPADPPPGLFEALGIRGGAVFRSQFDYLVVLEDPGALRELAPRMDGLSLLDARGVIVTTPPDGEEADFLSRFFAPGVGVPEDPVTGSAHCALAPYWAGRLGRAELVGRQISARGGLVRVVDRGDRVGLGGQAVTTLRGSLLSGA
jgi:predicted PhzF superfamily epimerase YddE/YHI9